MTQKILKNNDDISKDKLDKEIIIRLFGFLKPYKWWIFFSIILLIINTFTELMIPYVTKVVVDNHIVSDKNIISFSNEDKFNDFKNRYEKLKLDNYKFLGSYYSVIGNEKKLSIDKEELKNLNISKSNIFLIKNTEKNKSRIAKIKFKEISKELIAVEYSEYKKIKDTFSIKELIKLRAYSMEGIKFWGLIYIGLVAFRFFLFFGQIYLITYAAQHAMYDLREKLFSHIQKMPVKFFDNNPIGRLVTRATSDINTLNTMLSEGFVGLLQDILTLVGIVIIMLLMHWRLALVSFAILPIVITIVVIFKNKARVIYREIRKKISAINSRIAEDISGIKTIQLFNKQKDKIKNFHKINKEYYQKNLEEIKLFAFFRPIINVSKFVGIAILLWYAGGQILQNAISLGIFIAFLRYFERFFQPINRISEKFTVLQAAMSGAERIFDVLDKDTADYRETDEEPLLVEGKIDFQNVWLSYKKDEFVLKDISLSIKPGEKIALVGHTGSGKTSIVNLLLDFYDYQKGTITIDNKDLLSYSKNDIRKNIGMVQQDVFIFSGNIKNNIKMDNEKLTDEEVQKFSKLVNLDKFIQKMPNKYDQQVMEKGSTLSVGQKQLIAFARVLAYDPSIFILDEATSNIDTETEILIQDALEKVMKGRTSIIIAHRLSTIRNVDKIVVLHDGKIIEVGNHQELLAKKNYYYDLYRLQYESKLDA